MKKTFVLFLLVLVFTLLTSACLSSATPRTPTETPTSTPLVVTATPGAGQGVGAVATEEQIITTPTPQPTATPGPIDRLVADISNVTGLNRQVILGLTGEEWINLGISLLVTILGIFLLTRLVYTLLQFITRFIPGERDDEFIRAIKNQVYLIVSVWIIEYATGRLGFLSVESKETLNQLYFALYILAFTVILWKLIDLAFEWYQDTKVEGELDDQHRTSLMMLKRVLRGLLIIVAATVVLGNNGVNVTVVFAALIIGAFAVSLAAQDTLSDMIYGFIILFDRPYRVGDRVEVQELGTWGDVVEIGTRTTRISTRDNRMVIIPNSSIGKNQVTNYSYPDSSIRIQTELNIAYGSDFDQVESVITQTVLEVEEVLADMPVNVLLIEFGDSALKYRVRWWLESYLDTHIILDKVHKAIYIALEEAGIEMPFTTFDVNIKTGLDVIKDQEQAKNVRND
jgi:small-conductance mechanosensitive channel